MHDTVAASRYMDFVVQFLHLWGAFEEKYYKNPGVTQESCGIDDS